MRAQPALLAQLVDNLLENACKYSEPGTPILVRAWRKRGMAVLSVEDRGCGLAPDELSRVFEPFFRGQKPQLLGIAGVGLGLAVAQQIAKAFGGTLEARSEPESGCSFILRLPEALGSEVGASELGSEISEIVRARATAE